MPNPPKHTCQARFLWLPPTLHPAEPRPRSLSCGAGRTATSEWPRGRRRGVGVVEASGSFGGRWVEDGRAELVGVFSHIFQPRSWWFPFVPLFFGRWNSVETTEPTTWHPAAEPETGDSSHRARDIEAELQRLGNEQFTTRGPRAPPPHPWFSLRLSAHNSPYPVVSHSWGVRRRVKKMG